VSEIETDGARWVRLTVADTGIGMAPETIARVFEPFFTTKARGKGSGLGLPTAFGIIKQSRGDITVKSELGRGSIFEIRLPRAEGELAPRPPRRAISERPPAAATVLLVEDDDQVRAAMFTMLAGEGYRVLQAASATEALRICASHPEPIPLLLTDVVMPGASGAELARAAAELRPGLRVLFMSGYPDDTIAQHGVLDPKVQLIAKPFTPDVLARRIRELLET
jgi:two-component system, cell cycle sensor histidine kinase and response regulator CckA